MARDNNILHYQPDEQWPAVGAKLEAGFKTFVVNVDSVGTCIAYDPDTMRLEYESVSQLEDSKPSRWLYTFDEQDGKTTVSLQIDYYLSDSLLGQTLDKLLVERMNAKQTEQSLAGLKAQVEASLYRT